MSWEDFWQGANDSFAGGVQIGSDIYLKKLAAKIQARQADKQSLIDKIRAEEKRKQELADIKAHQDFTASENEKNRAASAAKDNTTLDTEYLRILRKPKAQWDEADQQIVDAYKEKNAPKPEKHSFNKDEFLLNAMGKDKYLEYLTKGAGDDMKRVRSEAQSNQMAEDIVKKEEGTLPDQIASLSASGPGSKYYERDQAALQPKQSELDAIRANRPGGQVALADSISFGQGRFATPEQLNQPVSPEQAASVTQELATLKQQLAELLKSLGAKQ